VQFVSHLQPLASEDRYVRRHMYIQRMSVKDLYDLNHLLIKTTFKVELKYSQVLYVAEETRKFLSSVSLKKLRM
jgi:predicted nucleotidyltransferase component of viral defense system